MNEEKTFTLKEAVMHMQKLQGELKISGDLKTSLQKQFDYMRHSIVPDLMDAEGIQNVTYPGIGRVSLTHDMYVSTPSEHRKDMQNWLNTNEFGDLIKPTVNASSLKALIKELMAEGSPVPERLLTITPFTRASITKS